MKILPLDGAWTLRKSSDSRDIPATVPGCVHLDLLRAGLIDEMSFAFRLDAGQWSPDYTEFRVVKADIHRGDGAIVGVGANPFTHSSVRDLEIPQLRAAVRPEMGRLLEFQHI